MSSLEINTFNEYTKYKLNLALTHNCFHQLEKFPQATVDDKRVLFNNCITKTTTLLSHLDLTKHDK
jgi:hypothetical protein